MFSVLFSMIYGAYEKRIRKRVLVDLLYFITAGVLWAAITCLLAVMMVFSAGTVNPSFWRIVPGTGFVLGLVFAFFPWILGLRKSGDDTNKN